MHFSNNPYKNEALQSLYIGLVLIVLGVVLSFVASLATSTFANFGVAFYGLIIIGGIKALLGLIYTLFPKYLKAKYEAKPQAANIVNKEMQEFADGLFGFSWKMSAKTTLYVVLGTIVFFGLIYLTLGR